jgi:hypothetical protein
LGGRSASGGLLPNGRPIQQYGKGVGTFGSSIAEAVEGEVWFGSNQAATDLTLTVTTEDPATTVIAATGPADSTETIFPATQAALPGITATDGNYLFLKAVSSDAQGDTVYYKLKLVQKTVDLVIAGVTIQGNTATAVSFNVGTRGTNGFGGGENHSGGAALATTEGFKNLGISGSSIDVTVNIGTKPEGAKIRYGHTDFLNAQEGVPSTGHITLTYQDSNVLTGVTNGEYIAVEVTNGLGDKGWYAFRVAMGSTDAALTALAVNGTSVTPIPGRNAAANGTTRTIFRMSTAGPWANLTAVATPSPGATVAYGMTNNTNANGNVTSWTNTTGVFPSFTAGRNLVVRVISEDGTVTSYYKFQLNNP